MYKLMQREAMATVPGNCSHGESAPGHMTLTTC